MGERYDLLGNVQHSLAGLSAKVTAKTGLDTNADNIVNFVDFAELASNWLNRL